MAVNIGINGFGRMGRLGLRAGWSKSELRFSHINEISTDAQGAAHLLKFDSVHGVWGPDCRGMDGLVYVDGQPISCTSNPDIVDTDWSGCDIVIEATGRHHKHR